MKTNINRIQQLNKEIEKKMVGKSYSEMMQDDEIKTLRKERDRLEQEEHRMRDKDFDEYLKEHPEMQQFFK